MMRISALAAAILAAVLAAAGPAEAGVVSFQGRVTSIGSSGSVDAISQYIAVGDTFSGSFEYATDGPYSTIGTIDNVGEWRQYNGAPTAFQLTFLTGNSAGFSINSVVPALSSISVANDILNSSNDAMLTDITSGVIWNFSNEFRSGLTQRNFVYRFWDSDANMQDSTDLATWDATRAFANVGVQSNELAFNSSATGFAQTANFVFTEFSTGTATAPEPGTLALMGLGSVGMGFGAWRKKRRAAKAAV